MIFSEQIVWTNITIGLVYQGQKCWSDAAMWFENALAGAIENEDLSIESSQTRVATRIGLIQRHFSYYSVTQLPFWGSPMNRFRRLICETFRQPYIRDPDDDWDGYLP